MASWMFWALAIPTWVVLGLMVAVGWWCAPVIFGAVKMLRGQACPVCEADDWNGAIAWPEEPEDATLLSSVVGLTEKRH